MTSASLSDISFWLCVAPTLHLPPRQTSRRSKISRSRGQDSKSPGVVTVDVSRGTDKVGGDCLSPHPSILSLSIDVCFSMCR